MGHIFNMKIIKINMSEPEKIIENAAKQRRADLEKYESDKKKKQMTLATEFVLDLLQSEKSVKNDDVKKEKHFLSFMSCFGGSSEPNGPEKNDIEKYQYLDQDTIWSKIAKFHHVDRPSDYQRGAEFWEKSSFWERKLHEKYERSKRKTFEYFRYEDLSQILKVLAEKDFVKTEPPYQPKQSNGPEVKYMYSYSEEIPQLVNP